MLADSSSRGTSSILAFSRTPAPGTSSPSPPPPASPASGYWLLGRSVGGAGTDTCPERAEHVRRGASVAGVELWERHVEERQELARRALGVRAGKLGQSSPDVLPCVRAGKGELVGLELLAVGVDEHRRRRRPPHELPRPLCATRQSIREVEVSRRRRLLALEELEEPPLGALVAALPAGGVPALARCRSSTCARRVSRCARCRPWMATSSTRCTGIRWRCRFPSASGPRMAPGRSWARPWPTSATSSSRPSACTATSKRSSPGCESRA